MTKDDDDYSKNGKELSRGYGGNTPRKDQRQEPTLSRYDEDDNYEEPDRDSDYTAGYHADDIDNEEEYEDDFSEDDERDLFEDDGPEDDVEPNDEEEQEAWLEEDNYGEQDNDSGHGWPFGLIAVAVIAVVLLVAGGYGVMQQRAATEAELRELRAALSTTSSPNGVSVSASREALTELQSAYDALAKELESLRLENRTLADTVAGLEGQVGGQRTAPTDTNSSAGEANTSPTSTASQPAQPAAAKPAAPAPPAPKPAVTKPAAKPAPPKPAEAATSGPWFVNFGSYATRNMAESWAARLHPGAGQVVILPTSSDGKTLYRLRVIGLADREVAKGVAHKLENELRVAQLWVGKD